MKITKSGLKKMAQSVGKISDILSPSEENVQSILDWIMPDLDPGELGISLRYYYRYLALQETAPEEAKKMVHHIDPLPQLFEKYTFLQKHISLTIRTGRAWWPYIKNYVKNPNYVLEMVGRKNPEIKKMLSTELGASYIAYFTNRLYEFFEIYFWKFPRYHNNCGGLILYKLIDRPSNSWGFCCRRCGAPISINDMDNLSYMGRKNRAVKNGSEKSS